jgi:hypothetical protein
MAVGDNVKHGIDGQSEFEDGFKILPVVIE